MKFEFQKYQGTGNDFILIDNRSQLFPKHDLGLIKRICERRFGIGSDGLILLEEDNSSDFYMNFYNPDGSQSFCGNGSRCIFRYTIDNGIVSDHANFRAIDGMHEVSLNQDWIQLKMADVELIESHESNDIINTGSPHYIIEVANVDDVDIIFQSHKIRYSDPFIQVGINVNFIEATSDGIKMRTYERGVEAETLSCGTGVTAAALSFAKDKLLSEVLVETKGGRLKVQFEKYNNGFRNIWLSGPAKRVFGGIIDA